MPPHELKMKANNRTVPFILVKETKLKFTFQKYTQVLMRFSQKLSIVHSSITGNVITLIVLINLQRLSNSLVNQLRFRTKMISLILKFLN